MLVDLPTSYQLRLFLIYYTVIIDEGEKLEPKRRDGRCHLHQYEDHLNSIEKPLLLTYIQNYVRRGLCALGRCYSQQTGRHSLVKMRSFMDLSECLLSRFGCLFCL